MLNPVFVQSRKKSKLPRGPLDNFFTFSNILMLSLGFVLIGSAIAVVYTQHLNRCLHIQLQRLHDLRDALHVEWSKLLLEQGTYASNSRVELVAEQKLHMKIPKTDQMMVIKP